MHAATSRVVIIRIFIFLMKIIHYLNNKWDVQHWGFGSFLKTARTAWKSTPQTNKNSKKINIINNKSQKNQQKFKNMGGDGGGGRRRSAGQFYLVNDHSLKKSRKRKNDKLIPFKKRRLPVEPVLAACLSELLGSR
jgi:hypothetical protein